MTDLFAQKAAEWDQLPFPQAISAGVGHALKTHVTFEPEWQVMDFGAGTGLVASVVAPHVANVVAVDVSESMLAALAAKPELQGRVEPICQDILTTPLGRHFDLIVSAMAMHHVADTSLLLRRFADHLNPGGRVALADLDAEDGTFHPPETEGVFHAGFDRAAFGGLLAEAGFEDVAFTTALEVSREGKRYPIFLVTARKG